MDFVTLFIVIAFFMYMYAHVSIEKHNLNKVKSEIDSVEQLINTKLVSLSKRISKLEQGELTRSETLEKFEERLKNVEADLQEFMIESPDEPLMLQSSEDFAFLRRIERIKGELANEDNIERSGYSADELHPNVHNLPHNSIPLEHGSLSDVEYAD